MTQWSPRRQWRECAWNCISQWNSTVIQVVDLRKYQHKWYLMGRVKLHAKLREGATKSQCNNSLWSFYGKAFWLVKENTILFRNTNEPKKTLLKNWQLGLGTYSDGLACACRRVKDVLRWIAIVPFQCCESFLSSPFKLLKQINRETPRTLKVIPEMKKQTLKPQQNNVCCLTGLCYNRHVTWVSCHRFANVHQKNIVFEIQKLVSFMLVYRFWMEADSVGGTTSSLFLGVVSATSCPLNVTHPMWKINVKTCLKLLSQTPSRPCCFYLSPSYHFVYLLPRWEKPLLHNTFVWAS